MTIRNRWFFSLFAGLFLLLTPFSGVAQRNISYPELAARPRESAVFFTFNPVPAPPSDSIRFAVSFRVSYDYLAFMKPQPGDDIQIPEGMTYYSNVEISLEMGESDTLKFPVREENAASARREARDRQRPNQAESAPSKDETGVSAKFRGIWKGTAFAKNYEDSQNAVKYLEGIIFITLPYGTYDYLFVFRESGRDAERATTVRRLSAKKKTPETYFSPVLLQSVDDASSSFPLLNFTNNSIYGRDFQVAVTVPAGSNYVSGLSVFPAKNQSANRAKPDPKQTKTDIVPEKREPTFTMTSTDAKRVSGKRMSYKNVNEAVAVLEDDSQFDVLLFPITAGQFKNGNYVLELSGPEAKSIWNWRFLTLWRDMPRSLYNLDISIDMMQFIVSKEQLKELKSGSMPDREKKFLAFWSEKDPSKDTEFNELMTEYFRRIDYSFDTFSTPQKPGYDSDQGQTYIRMGPPLKIRRDFSTGSSALEIWEYPGKQEIVFRAMSGFGDFERIK